MPIFQSYLKDFTFLYLPSLLVLVAIAFLPTKLDSLWFYFITFFLLDIGHTYLTWYRTILNSQERHRTHLTITVPLAILLISILWWYWKIPHYLSAVAYLTLFHNLRQGWGIVRWYEKKNQRISKNYLFYHILTILPILIFHFRNLPFKVSFYTDKDLFLVQNFNSVFYYMFLYLYLSILLFWAVTEIFAAIKSQKLEWNRLVAMSFFMGVYSYSFIFSKNLIQLLAILIISHALHYIFIMNKYLQIKKWSTNKIFFNLLTLLLFGGLFSYFLEEYWLENIFQYVGLPLAPWEILIALLYIVPVLSHFIWDFYLWKNTHPENRGLYE